MRSKELFSIKSLSQYSASVLLCIGLAFVAMDSKGQDNFNKKVNSLISKSVPVVHEDELNNKLARGENLTLLDTRSEEEFNISRIEDAEFIDYDSFNENMVSHIPKDQEIIVYCSVGYRSEKIGEKLQELGYTNVLNLYGGIFDWKNKNHKVVNKVGEPTDSVHTYNKNWSKWLYKGIKVYD